MNMFIRPLVSSLILFGILLLLHLTGAFIVSLSALTAFFMMLSGLILFTYIFGSGHPRLLFTSSVIFFSGIMIFLSNTFPVYYAGKDYIAILSIICSLSFLLLFINDRENKKYALWSLIAFVLFCVSLNSIMALHPRELFYWFVAILKRSWLLLAMLFIYVMYILRK
ncbi:MAG: hypothetical protein LWX56_08675 [Ignavibacteria bacterium]|nr:hypothetical protein [Ignavibacteria bacterium]